MTDAGRQRIDKWLWFARVVKTRALAQDLAASGHVRLNGRKVDAASQPVKPGDVLTIGLHGRVRIHRVLAFADRRGGAPEARLLYEDLTPPDPTARPDPTDDEDADGEDADGEADARPAAPSEGGAAPPPRSDAPRAVRGEGRPTKRERRRLGRLPTGEEP